MTAALSTPLRWSWTRLYNGYGTLKHWHHAAPDYDTAFLSDGLWWPLGPDGRAASREWTEPVS